MRKLVVQMFTTVDGFITGRDGEFDADFDPSDEEKRFANDVFGSAGGVVFGRLSYEGFVSFWDSLDTTDSSIGRHDIEFAEIFRALPRIVVSRTLQAVPDNTVLIKEDIGAAVSALKSQPGGDLIAVCGPPLVATLIGLGVVDECRLMIRPKAQGRGRALFGDVGQDVRMRLLATRAFESGTVLHHYRLGDD